LKHSLDELPLQLGMGQGITMPIFDQGYQHWQGRLSGRALRWWAITWRGVRTLFRSRWTRVAVIIALSPCLALAGVLVFWGLVENRVSFIQPLLAMMSGLPEELRQKPEAYRVMIWTLAFQFFYSLQITFMMIIVAIVGPDLISKDLRFNAIPLYFSRPLTRWDYFLGKLGVIGFFVGLVTVAPVTIAYVLGVAFSLDVKIVQDTWHLWIGGVLAGLVMVVSAGTLMLALSSLTRNSRYVSALWIGFWLVTQVVSGILIATLQEEAWPPICSYTHNLQRVCERLLDTERAWTTIDKLVASFDRTRQQAMQGGPFGANLQRGIKVAQYGTVEAPQPADEADQRVRAAGLSPVRVLFVTSKTDAPEDKKQLVVGQRPAAGEMAFRGQTITLFVVEAGALKRNPKLITRLLRQRTRDPEEEFATSYRWYRQQFPWTWSAGVIAALFVVSLLILTTRVRSLDRLK
jgi:ABC-2 type transport system permease protein